jgi:hypothetical protein
VNIHNTGILKTSAPGIIDEQMEVVALLCDGINGAVPPNGNAV